MQSDIHLLFANHLLDYCQDSPEQLFEALSSKNNFQEFFALLELSRDAAIQQGLDNLTVEIPVSESDEIVIQGQANIGLMLKAAASPAFVTNKSKSERKNTLIHQIFKQDIRQNFF